MAVEVRSGCAADPSARRPCLQVLQCQPSVAKGASGRSSARRPCPQVHQGHPRVAKGASDRSSARRPCPQVPQGHPGVAKRVLDRSSARRPCPQVLQRHPCVAKGGLLTGLRHCDLAHRYSRGIQAWRDRHQSHVAPARDIHRAGSQCPQTPQRQIALRGEANWTSPSKRLCPTPTLKGISRLDRQDK